MTHRKEEYDVNGHEVTIQQVNEDGDISTWIDGLAGNVEEAKEELPEVIRETVETNERVEDEWAGIQTVLAYMAGNDYLFCTKCNSFYDRDDVGRTKFAGHICGDCHRDNQECEESPDGEHEDVCQNPRQKRNARVSTRYRCKHCGRVRKTVATG